MKGTRLLILTLFTIFASNSCISAQDMEQQEERMLVGGFTEWRELADDDIQIFTKAIAGHNCYSFEPVRLKTQVVAGLNYLFDCVATDHETGKKYSAEIRVFLSLQQEISLTGIEIKEEIIDRK